MCPPQDEAKQERIKRLIESINESAKHVAAATLTFLAVCVYIGIAVSSTSDEVLFLGTSIGLPLFDVQIRLASFYVVAPALLVVLHLHLLLLLYLLARKVVAYVRLPNPEDEETDLFFPPLPISILRGHDHPGVIRFLLWLLLIVTLLVPVFLLILIQIKFLPYHLSGITFYHKILVLLDLALIWYFFFYTPTAEKKDGGIVAARGLPSARLRSTPAFLFLLVLTLGAFISSTFLAGGPKRDSLLSVPKPRWLERGLSENLSLPESVLVAGEWTPEKGLAPKNVRGVQLAGRDLRGADFTGAILINADFRGADLTGAVFQGADLRGAKFTPFGGASEVQEALSEALASDLERTRVNLSKAHSRALSRVTSLRRVNFRGAKLEGASLLMADLREADLFRATLDEADLSLADLRGAILHKASLKKTKLAHAVVNTADLRDADLRFADLRRAHLIGTDLRKALLQVADLRGADLTMAKLVEVDAAVADFSAANVLGADFRSAKLHSSIGLALRGVDLRGAHLGASDLCQRSDASGKKVPNFGSFESSDLRFAVNDQARKPSYFEDREELYWLELKNLAESEPLLKAKINTRSTDVCLVPSDSVKLIGKRGLLYYGSARPGPMQEWPEIPTVTERQYHEALARMLVESACTSRRSGDGYEVIKGILIDISGDLPPPRPLLTLALARELSGRLTEAEALNDALADVRKLREAIEDEDPRALQEREREVEALKSRCPALQLLSEEQRASIEQAAKEDPLRTDDDAPVL